MFNFIYPEVGNKIFLYLLGNKNFFIWYFYQSDVESLLIYQSMIGSGQEVEIEDIGLIEKSAEIVLKYKKRKKAIVI